MRHLESGVRLFAPGTDITFVVELVSETSVNLLTDRHHTPLCDIEEQLEVEIVVGSRYAAICDGVPDLVPAKCAYELILQQLGRKSCELLDLYAEAMRENVGWKDSDADELIHEYNVSILVEDAGDDLGHSADGSKLLFAGEFDVGIVTSTAEAGEARHGVEVTGYLGRLGKTREDGAIAMQVRYGIANRRDNKEP